MFKKLLNYLKLLLKYLAYRFIEGKGTNKYFNIINRKFHIYIDFKEKMLKNTIVYNVRKLKHRNRITFWIGFREEVEIERVSINGMQHDNFRLYSITIPMFNYKVNYLVINKINLETTSENLEVEIQYRLRIANHRDDMSTMLENFITEDEFHLYALWYPIIGNCINGKDILSGNIPKSTKCPFEVEVSLSEKGIVLGEGEVVKKSETDYVIKNFKHGLNEIFICGGKVSKITYSMGNLDINFYFRSSKQKYFNNFSDVLFRGIEDIINSLQNYHLNSLNIYCLPIIAGGYGLTHSVIVNENYFFTSSIFDSNYKYTLIWHEFIHHWWGKRVFSKGEGKYLLTEGMTVLFEWITTRKILGKDYFKLIINNAIDEVLEITGFDKSISTANRIPPFGNVVIYKKAPLVLYQLVNIVGEEKFIQYCRKFLERPGCYEWQDFIDGLQKYTKTDLARYNNTWVKEKGIPIVSNNQSYILVDKRTELEKQLDYHVSQYRKDKDYKKLYEWLLKQKVHDKYWNKYYYYLGICYLEDKNYVEAKECYEKIDKTKDVKYYWEGIYQKLILELKEGNTEKCIEYLYEILKHSYPIKDLRKLFDIYETMKQEDSHSVFK